VSPPAYLQGLRISNIQFVAERGQPKISFHFRPLSNQKSKASGDDNSMGLDFDPAAHAPPKGLN
jgi:hypothetical protein